MPDNMNVQPELEGFEVETVFENRVHERLAFTLKIDGDEFKGHFHEKEILWLHPHPKQHIGESKVASIEANIHAQMKGHLNFSAEGSVLELKPAFEDRLHERQQFTLHVQGDEFKGFVHEGEIQWFHPQPQQKLKENVVQAMESEIHEKVAEQEQESKYEN